MFSSSGQYPPFVRNGSKYDLLTYEGRLLHTMQVVSPASLFASSKEDETAMQLLAEYDAGKRSSTTANADLWKAQELISARYHPQTKELIPWMFRMSAFVPVNIPICLGMLTAPATVGPTLFWQWLNQSYNVAVNYANGNKTNPMSTGQIMQSYSFATATACGIAVGLNEAVKRAGSLSPGARFAVQKLVPFIAAASAGASNVMLMRWNERVNGIDVTDAEGNVVGRSIEAGKMGLNQVAMTRVVLPAPILVGPPLVFALIQKMGMWPRARPAELLLQVSVITAGLAIGLPVALAMFPQEVEVSVDKLEENFQNLKDADGKPLKSVFYNRGL